MKYPESCSTSRHFIWVTDFAQSHEVVECFISNPEWFMKYRNIYIYTWKVRESLQVVFFNMFSLFEYVWRSFCTNFMASSTLKAVAGFVNLRELEGSWTAIDLPYHSPNLFWSWPDAEFPPSAKETKKSHVPSPFSNSKLSKTERRKHTQQLTATWAPTIAITGIILSLEMA